MQEDEGAQEAHASGGDDDYQHLRPRRASLLEGGPKPLHGPRAFGLEPLAHAAMLPESRRANAEIVGRRPFSGTGHPGDQRSSCAESLTLTATIG